MAEQQFGNFTITTDYAYGSFRDLESHIKYLDNLRYDLKGGNFNQEIRKTLAKRMENYAKQFLTEGGHVKTTYLRNSIIGYTEGAHSITVEATAPYSGHIEYGFRKGGRFIGPFPYLRPALQTVSAESRELLPEYLAERVIYPNSSGRYKGLGGLNMDRSLTSEKFGNLGNVLLGSSGVKAGSYKPGVTSRISTKNAYSKTSFSKYNSVVQQKGESWVRNTGVKGDTFRR